MVPRAAAGRGHVLHDLHRDCAPFQAAWASGWGLLLWDLSLRRAGPTIGHIRDAAPLRLVAERNSGPAPHVHLRNRVMVPRREACPRPEIEGPQPKVSRL